MARQSRERHHVERLQVLRQALDEKLISRRDAPSAYFFSMDALRENIDSLKSAGFPSGDGRAATHTVAVKANPLLEVLRACKSSGVGAEAASMGELQLALEAGFPRDAIVYDSPTKTRREIAFALAHRVKINADNLDELQVIREEIAMAGLDPGEVSVGLRINPQVGVGAIAALSTASDHSKFGLALSNYSDAIGAAFGAHSWLRRIHVHTGSQGFGLETLVESVATAVSFARDANRRAGASRVTAIDIGGGLPVHYGKDDPSADPFGTYASLLGERLAAEDGSAFEFDLITEFGRSLTAKCSFACSFVEYVKTSGSRRILLQHLGADTLVRPCYLPSAFPLRVFCADASARPLESPTKVDRYVETDVGGPLCFAGDVIASNRLLPPEIAPGSLVIVPDVGAYTLSMFSRYNSREFPSVFGYTRTETGGYQIAVLRKGETLDDLVEFWSPPSGT